MADHRDALDDGSQSRELPGRRRRADAQRSVDALLLAAKEVFATSGVDAPVREIADKAGVGIGTLYRNFPQRADLVAAVFRREIDACADAAPLLAGKYAPGDALGRWLQRYAAFIATKRGLASVLHSGNPVFNSLPAYFDQRLQPALRSLLDAAVAAGDVRSDIEPDDLLTAVGRLSMQEHRGRPDHAERMVGLLIDGLRYRAGQASDPSSC
ncbi:MAG: helix-turn-helix domain containing protein [Ancalomicrobiaceae bacterium]|nr:helix-turn-helix domain containing protein [Ancalomicrobiaceae bacterium]